MNKDRQQAWYGIVKALEAVRHPYDSPVYVMGYMVTRVKVRTNPCDVYQFSPAGVGPTYYYETRDGKWSKE